MIDVFYFNETKLEIDGYFTKAKYLIEGKERPDPTKPAMNSILKGCSSASDVLDKKSEFYVLLERYEIKEASNLDYYDFENQKYNIVDSKLIDELKKEYGEDVEKTLTLLNYVAIHRKERTANNFENIGYILLSGTHITLRISWNELLKDEGNVPLATNMFFLTNRFWFKLNKGFGGTDLPKSFDVISKSQMVLSRVLNDTVSEKYKKLKVLFNKGELTQEQAISRLIHYKESIKNPEDIHESNYQDALSLITEDSIEKYINDRDYEKTLRIKINDDYQAALEELSDKKIIVDQLEKSREQLIGERKHKIDLLKAQKAPLDNIISIKYRNNKIALLALLIIYYACYVVVHTKFPDMIATLASVILGAIPVILSCVFALIFEKKFNPLVLLEKRKERIILNVYTKFNFNIQLYNQLLNEFEDI